jgi:hypothetical protein
MDKSDLSSRVGIEVLPCVVVDMDGGARGAKDGPCTGLEGEV